MIKLLTPYAPFEKRLLEVISVFIAVLMTTIWGVDSFSFTTPTYPLHIFLILYGIITYYLTRWNKVNYKKLVLPLILILYGATTYYWFSASGVNTPTGVGAIVVATVSFIFSPPRLRSFTFWFNIVYLSALIIGHYHFHEYMRFGETSYKAAIFEYAGVALGQIILIYLLKVQVDAERKTIKIKNDQLEHLNKSLKSTVESQFNTLKELTNTQNKLLESEKMASMGTLTAGLAHEINNPLNFVGGVVSPIKKDIEELLEIVSEENKEKAEILASEINILLESIENGTERASQVVKKLLNLTPGRNSSSEFHPFDLSELLADIIRLVEKSTPHIEFSADIQEGITLEGNEIEINQVILNLLRNSIQAIPEDTRGLINVSCSKDDLVHLRIQDNGAGMDKETAENAFNAFYTTKEHGTGTGLGLFISHGIVKKHRGNIQIESTLDQGTTIDIYLPEKAAPQEEK